MNTKAIVATLGATAANAAGAMSMSATLESEILDHGDYEFMNFISKHGRSYATKAEFQFRSKIFKAHLAELEAFNS